MASENGIDFVRGVAALHCRSVFSRAALARNLGLQGHAIEDFVAGKRELDDDAMAALVAILFHGKARWDAEAQCLADVVKPAAALRSREDEARVRA
jgi:hypothetical protein